MCWRHWPSVRIGDYAYKQAWVPGLLAQGIFAAIDGEDALHLVKQFLINDGFMLAFIYFVLVPDHASVNRIFEQLTECSGAEYYPANFPAIFVRADLGPISLCSKFVDQLRHGLKLGISPEQVTDSLSFLLIHHQLAVTEFISKGNGASHPNALFLGGRNLVADTLAGNLAFELSEGQ